jgi:hypothetical protein
MTLAPAFRQSHQQRVEAHHLDIVDAHAATSRRTISMRSSGVNMGFFEGLVVTPMISRSTSVAPGG